MAPQTNNCPNAAQRHQRRRATKRPLTTKLATAAPAGESRMIRLGGGHAAGQWRNVIACATNNKPQFRDVAKALTQQVCYLYA